MDKLIEAQLKKCVFADLSNYNPETGTFFIKKYEKPTYLVGSCYYVKVLPDMLLTNSVIATSWNKCTAPKDLYLKIFVSKTLGKMVYVDSMGVNNDTNEDTNNLWSGWLNTEELTQLAKIA